MFPNVYFIFLHENVNLLFLDVLQVRLIYCDTVNSLLIFETALSVAQPGPQNNPIIMLSQQ